MCKANAEAFMTSEIHWKSEKKYCSFSERVTSISIYRKRQQNLSEFTSIRFNTEINRKSRMNALSVVILFDLVLL